MSTTLEEFRDVLNADAHVDIGRLRSCAKHGIPDDVRFH